MLDLLKAFGPATGALIGAGIGLITLTVRIPSSPLRYWSWRLRNHMDTVNALDNERHAAQREELLRRSDALASKVASISRIPTPWEGYFVGAVCFGAFVWGLAGFFVEAVMPPDDLVASWIYQVLGTLIAGYYTIVVPTNYFRDIRSERKRYIEAGCPREFKVKPMFIGRKLAERKEWRRKRLAAATEENPRSGRKKVAVKRTKETRQAEAGATPSQAFDSTEFGGNA